MGREIVLVVPGRGQSTRQEKYARVGRAFGQQGISPEFIDIEWSNSLQENIEGVEEEAKKVLSEYDDPGVYVFGFSWGAVCGFAASPEFSPEAQVLCSMSPDFREDYEQLSRMKRILNRRFSSGVEDKPSLNVLSEKELGDLYLLYGEKEYRGRLGIGAFGYGDIAEKRLELLDARQVIVEGVGHGLDESYLSEIESVVEEIG
ncbi:MAG: hypothetical protein ABEI58_01240 [Candidatus Nanohaloarchaea archaeon]